MPTIVLIKKKNTFYSIFTLTKGNNLRFKIAETLDEIAVFLFKKKSLDYKE
jgi:hypothetical protein